MKLLDRVVTLCSVLRNCHTVSESDHALLHSYQQCMLLLLSRFSRVRLCATPETAAHQAPPSLDSPGKNIGVGCHCLLQCMKVKSESEASQLYPTLSNPMEGTSFSTSLPALVVTFVFFIITILVGVQCYLTVALTCISQ